MNKRLVLLITVMLILLSSFGFAVIDWDANGLLYTQALYNESGSIMPTSSVYPDYASLNDWSGNEKYGTIVNSFDIVSDEVDFAQFKLIQGSADELYYGNNALPEIESSSAFTWGAWVKLNSQDESYNLIHNYELWYGLAVRSDGTVASQARGTWSQGAVSTATVDDDVWHLVIGSQTATNMTIFIDGVTDGTYLGAKVSVSGTDPYTVFAGNPTGQLEGNVSSFFVLDDSIDVEEALDLYSRGRNYNPYIVPPPPTIDDSTESTAVVRQTGSVSFVNPTTIVSSTFEVPLNNTPVYGVYTFDVSSNNNNDMYCEVLIDGSPVANLSRTQTTGDQGDATILFPTLILRNDTGSHTQSMECERITGVGLITIENTVGIGHFLIDEENNIIANNATTFNNIITSGSSFSFIDSLDITISNKTADDKYHSMVVEGMVEFSNNDGSPELLAVYADINGTNCSINPRDVGDGDSGSVSYDCILENVTANQKYTLNFYGNGTNSNYQGSLISKDLFLSDSEIAGGTGILLGTIFSDNTPTRLFNGTGGNINHAVANVFQKVGYSILTDLDTTVDMYIKIINGDTYQTINFTREFTAGQIGVLIGQDILENIPEDPDYQIELWANCGTVGATCEIRGGASDGYITDVTTTILNTFNITAYNAWDGSQVLVFNATNGATFSTTTGLIEFITEGQYENITVSAIGYVDQVFLNHNTSEIINASIHQSSIELTATTITGDYPVLSFSVITDQGIFSTTNGTIYINPNIDSYLWNFTASGYLDVDNIEVDVTSATQSITVAGFSDSHAVFRDASTLDPLVNADVVLTYPNGITYDFTTNSSGAISFAGFRDGAYNIYNLTFEGYEGYVTPITFSENISVLPSSVTYDIARTNITIRFYDRETSELILENVTFSIEGLFTNSTTTGVYSFNGMTISAGIYNLYASAPSYDIALKSFEYTGQNNVSLELYLINSTADNVIATIARVYDLGYNLLPNADVRLEEYVASIQGFSEVSQCFSDSNGECTFQVEQGIKVYRIIAYAEINGITYTETSSETGSPIYLDQTIYELYLGEGNTFEVSDLYDLTAYLENTDLVNNVSFTDGIFYDSDGLSHEVCLEYFYIDGFEEKAWPNSKTCDFASSGTLNSNQSGFLLNRSYTNIVKIYVNESGSIIVYDSRTYDKAGGLAEQLGSFIKPLFVFLMGCCVALMFFTKKVIAWCIGIFILICFSLYFVSNLLGSFISSAGIIECFLILWLAKKENDNDTV